MKLIVIVLLIWNIIQISQAKKIAYFTHIECPAPHSDKVYDYTCSLVKNNDGIPTLNVSFKLKEETSTISMHFKVRGKQGTKAEETLLVFDLDVCDALSATHEHYFLKMIFNELRRVSNLPNDCPLKKDFAYTIHGFTIDSSALPNYVPEISWSVLSHFNISQQKVATFNSYGKLSEKIEL
ncbi:uncharacterized protein LOC142236696 [Haematobia irritans]|uniref:uncharacterized protein LOC142236696 n=1 Tax=Haematobia irritans TaxID=7368 RepID=UPI003F4FED7E